MSHIRVKRERERESAMAVELMHQQAETTASRRTMRRKSFDSGGVRQSSAARRLSTIRRSLIGRRQMVLQTASPSVLRVAGRSSSPSSSSSSSSSAAASVGSQDGAVAFESAAVSVRSQEIPVGLWYPIELGSSQGGQPTGASSSSSSLTYAHNISVAKIARILLRLEYLPPTWFDRELVLTASAGVIEGKENQSTFKVSGEILGGVVLCHGYLGSKYDLVDFAEGLSKAGFVVISPEFAETLSNPNVMPKQEGGEGATRSEILEEAVSSILTNRFGIPKNRVSLLGHSAGAGTVVQARGQYAARVAIAGFRKPPGEDLARDPLLVIASRGDNVISLYPKSGGKFGPQDGVVSAVNSLGKPVSVIDGSPEALAGLGTQGAQSPVFVKYDGEEVPCHISFLSSRTNNAMVEALSSILPVAKFLNIPLLDFDVYEQTRDSDKYLSDLVPAVVRWLLSVQKV